MIRSIVVPLSDPGADDPGLEVAERLGEALGVPVEAVHHDVAPEDLPDAIVGRLEPGTMLVMHSERANRWSGEASVAEHVLDRWEGLTVLAGPDCRAAGHGPILVPVDGSADAERAVPFARGLARSVGVDVELVRVVPTDDPTDEAERDLGRLAAAGGLATRVLAHNDPVRALCDRAADIGSAYLVLSSHGDRHTPRPTISRTSTGLVAEAGRPVVIVGPGHRS